jgi:hypothetical protein
MQRRIAFSLVPLLAFLSAWGVACAEKPLTGSVETTRGVRVLTLSGTPRENGYARGYLLAREILDSTTAFFQIMRPKGQDYAKLAQTILPALTRPPHIQQELEGLVEGMRAKLGEEALQVQAIGGPLTADALWVFLTLPEIHCSSFAAWGALTPDGGCVLGRNLDYAGKEVAAVTALLVVHHSADPKRKSWVSPSNSIMTGVTTGINEEGVFIAVHDSGQTGAPVPPANLRWFVLREFLETVSAKQDLAAQAAEFFRDNRILRGTNLLVCGPGAKAFVVEYDGNVKLDCGVTIRQPEAGREWIAVTNHFRARTKPAECARYTALAETLQSMADTGKKIGDLQEAWRVIGKAGVDSTQLTLVYRPGERKMVFSFTDGKQPAHRLKPVEFSLDELLAKKVPAGP